MIKSRAIKDHHYSHRTKKGKTFTHWYITDEKYFIGDRPGMKALKSKPILTMTSLIGKSIIDNPWQEWESENAEMIISRTNGTPINYLKTTSQEKIQFYEDTALVDVYEHLVRALTSDTIITFKMITAWHDMVFKKIYPFAGKIRTVELSKGSGAHHTEWTWRMSHLNGIEDLDRLVQQTSAETINDTELISLKVAEVVSEFLFIHPFREGNGRISRLLGDIILAKNNFPMIGMNLMTDELDYLKRVREGYNKNYKPLAETIKEKLIERIS